ncbi:MAG: uncharacterized protein KVP18_004871 [Porospora cf. gigantea A]|uniref:uncharacterized protein n=1 Tax=Porospora cf. gigantea A TaxID=2853593 RepID=UPI00355A43E1|nr:MAG: hypothetical protein KVP18_004871 [Porospora cf. gigantea A]
MVVVTAAALLRGVIAGLTPADLEMGEEGEMPMTAEDAGLPELADLEMGEGGDMDMGDENYSNTTVPPPAPGPSPSPTPSLVPVPSPVPNQPNVISIQPPAPCPAAAAADNSPVVVNVSVGDDCCDEDEGSHAIVDDGHTHHFNHKWSRHPPAHHRPSDDARLVPRERPVITV